jgi:uncharacterized membrane protein
MSHEQTKASGIQILPRPRHRLVRLLINNSPYLILYAIAIFLVAMTDHNPASAKSAWTYFVPLVGLVSAISGWNGHAGDSLQTRARYLLQQALHWGSLLVVIWLLFRPDVQYFLMAEQDGFVLIYLVGLSSILAGIYLDWKMAVFGLFLIVSGVFIAFLNDNALLLAVGGTAMLAVVVSAFMWIRFHQHAETEAKNEPGVAKP